MSYEQTRLQIENSSWFREFAEHDFIPAIHLINLARSQFEHELRAIISRHRRQQGHIDRIKQFCHLTPPGD